MCTSQRSRMPQTKTSNIVAGGRPLSVRHQYYDKWDSNLARCFDNYETLSFGPDLEAVPVPDLLHKDSLRSILPTPQSRRRQYRAIDLRLCVYFTNIQMISSPFAALPIWSSPSSSPPIRLWRLLTSIEHYQHNYRSYWESKTRSENWTETKAVGMYKRQTNTSLEDTPTKSGLLDIPWGPAELIILERTVPHWNQSLSLSGFWSMAISTVENSLLNNLINGTLLEIDR